MRGGFFFFCFLITMAGLVVRGAQMYRRRDTARRGKYCFSCAMKIPTHARFCPHCGHHV